jgi:chaperonin GroES
MSLRPLTDRVLIKRITSEEKTAGGIIIPDNAQEKPFEGVVVAAGTGKLLDNGKTIGLQVKEGDHVFFRKYGGTDVTIDGVDHLIMREEEILAIKL